jgi:hypothetical protein
MKKIILHFTVVLLFTAACLYGCSSSSGEESEKGAIRKMTDQVAHDLSHKIRNPIDKARAVKGQEEERLNDWEDAADESSRDD